MMYLAMTSRGLPPIKEVVLLPPHNGWRAPKVAADAAKQNGAAMTASISSKLLCIENTHHAK